MNECVFRTGERSLQYGSLMDDVAISPTYLQHAWRFSRVFCTAYFSYRNPNIFPPPASKCPPNTPPAQRSAAQQAIQHRIDPCNVPRYRFLQNPLPLRVCFSVYAWLYATQKPNCYTNPPFFLRESVALEYRFFLFQTPNPWTLYVWLAS